MRGKTWGDRLAAAAPAPAPVPVPEPARPKPPPPPPNPAAAASGAASVGLLLIDLQMAFTVGGWAQCFGAGSQVRGTYHTPACGLRNAA